MKLPRIKGSITLEIPGDPKAKTRPKVRVIRKKGAFRGSSYNSSENIKNEEWLGSVAIEYAPEEPHDWAVTVEATYFFRIPKSKPKWWQWMAYRGFIRPITKPDLDNLNKLLWDALTRAGFWNDDSQVVAESSKKRYSNKPRTHIIIKMYECPTHEDFKDMMKAQ